MTTRLVQILAWLSAAAIIFVTVSPIGLRPHDVLPVNTDRFLAFMVMGGLFVIAYPRHWILIAVAVTLSAGGIELLQYLSPTRHARLHDAEIKAAGAACGSLIGLAYARWAKQRVSRV